jgi:hypothetical protein
MQLFYWLDSTRNLYATKVVVLAVFLLTVFHWLFNATLLCLDSGFSKPYTLITSSLISRNLLEFGSILTISLQFLIPVESLWESEAVFKYIFFVVTVSGTTLLFLRLTSSAHHSLLVTTVGLNMAITMAYRHAFPLKPIAPSMSDIIPTRIFQSRHMPFLVLLFNFSDALFSKSLGIAVISCASFFWSWFYIRYFLWFPFAQIRGDHSETFNFDLLFPRWSRTQVSWVTVLVHKIACGIYPRLFTLRAPIDGGVLYAQRDTALAEKVGQSAEDRAAYEARRLKAIKFLEQNIKVFKSANTADSADEKVPLDSII